MFNFLGNKIIRTGIIGIAILILINIGVKKIGNEIDKFYEKVNEKYGIEIIVGK